VATGPFVVNVARLRRSVGTTQHEVRKGEFDPGGTLAPDGAADSRVPEGADVEADVVVESFLGGVMVTGNVRAPWEGVCRRCTAPVTGETVVPVKERFIDLQAMETEADDEAYPIVDDAVDLYPLVRDAVVLELPLAPLCREDCKGLCAWCGADLNEADCGCVAPRDPRWANLDVLRQHAHESS
jgi:uncharacterized protein